MCVWACPHRWQDVLLAGPVNAALRGVPSAVVLFGDDHQLQEDVFGGCEDGTTDPRVTSLVAHALRAVLKGVQSRRAAVSSGGAAAAGSASSAPAAAHVAAYMSVVKVFGEEAVDLLAASRTRPAGAPTSPDGDTHRQLGVLEDSVFE
jgi:hypothetical protein